MGHNCGLYNRDRQTSPFFFDKKDSIVFQDFYAKVDAFIANTYRTFEKIRRDFLFLVLSDHGF